MQGKQQQAWENAELWARGEGRRKAQLELGSEWNANDKDYRIYVSGPNGSAYLPDFFMGNIDVFLCEKTQNDLQNKLEEVVGKLAAYKKEGGSCE